MSIKKMVMVMGVLLMVVGCASNAGGVVRVDPRDMQDTDANYGAEDLHLFVHKMVSSMLQSDVFNSDTKKYISLGELKIASGVDEHIDTLLIKNSIRTNLIKSTRVNFIDSEHLKEFKRDNLIKRDFLLTGDIHAIKKDNQKAIDNFYALTLILTNVKTSKIIWTEEKEIRKIIKK